MAGKRYREQEIRGAQAVDPGTGVVTELGTITGMVPQQVGRRKVKREVRFVMVQVRSKTARGLSGLQLSGAQWRVLWGVIDHIVIDAGVARVQTGELAGILGYTPRFTSRVLGQLRERGVLARERQGVWRINPHLVGFGSVEAWAERMGDAPAIDWEGP